MSIFDATARVCMQDNGIKFYEQDVLPCSYLFEGDQVIDIIVDYLFSGFGIVVAQNNGHSFRNSDKACLLKVGYNDFQVFEKDGTKISNVSTTSCALAPDENNERLKFQITIKKNSISMDWLTEDRAGEYRRFNLGTYKFSSGLNEYRIGFYSNAGNIIRTVTFKQNVPEGWTTSIKNTCGGRIRFMKDAFLFENCENNAEIEQKEIELEPGKYYLRYEKENLNGKNDIKCYVMPSTAPHDDDHFEDEKKNILENDNTFFLGTKTQVNLKFKGKNGKIKDICITNNKDASFVETEGSATTMNGSYITILLDGVEQVKWRGIIQKTPSFDSFLTKCPYAIVETESQRLSMEECGIYLNAEYGYVYKVDEKALYVCKPDYETVYRKVDIDISDEERSINIFRNITAFIYELLVADGSGAESDFINQKTSIKYVPEQIGGPIIVTDSKKNSLDLSASYREVVIGGYTVAFYVSGRPIKVADGMPCNIMDISLYGIPAGASINAGKTTIEEAASSYDLIPPEAYGIEGDYFAIDKLYLQKYPHIAIAYRDVENYSYLFTNYEREVFEDPAGRIVLEKDVTDSDGAITVYGILKDAIVKSDRIYRIPSAELVGSIDLYADAYEVVPSTEYEVNYLANEIQLSDTAKQKYKSLVIDYLKQDSYTVNYDESMQQYAVEISSGDTKTFVNYNGRKDGAMVDSVATGIRMDESKYIILRRKRS